MPLADARQGKDQEEGRAVTNRMLMLIAMGVMAGSSVAQGAVVHENPFNGAAADSGSFSQAGQRLAGQFQLESASNVDRVTWYGTMYSADPLDTGDTWSFDLVIYGESAGLPGAMLAGQPVTAAVTDTGVNLGGERVYLFDARISSIALAAGTPYWVSAVNTGTQDTFRWAQGTAGLRSAIGDCCNWRLDSDPSRTPLNFSLHSATAPGVGSPLQQLLGEVTGVGPGKSLASKIALAQAYYDVPDVQATCAVLADFVNEVRAQSGKRLGTQSADKLTADAGAIMNSLGCD
jgi:hypothetical protein